MRAQFEARARSIGGEPLSARIKITRMQLHKENNTRWRIMMLAGSGDSSSAKKERLNDRASAVDLRTTAHAAL